MNTLEKLTPTEKRFGMTAVEKGHITKEQLLDALKIQVEENLEKGTHRFIGEILVEMNAISMKKLPLPSQAKRFGTVAFKKGFITKEQLFEALKTQIEENLEYGTHRILGAILVEMNAINVSQFREVFTELGLGDYR